MMCIPAAERAVTERWRCRPSGQAGKSAVKGGKEDGKIVTKSVKQWLLETDVVVANPKSLNP